MVRGRARHEGHRARTAMGLPVLRSQAPRPRPDPRRGRCAARAASACSTTAWRSRATSTSCAGCTAMLLAKGVHVVKTTDHKVGFGLYFTDPDGNRFEFFRETVTDDEEGKRVLGAAQRAQRADRTSTPCYTASHSRETHDADARQLRRLPHPQVVPPDRGDARQRDRPATPTARRCARSSSRRRSTTPTPAGSARTSSDIVGPSATLGEEFGRRIVEAACGAGAVQSYGKACLVGVHGEYEHGNAFLTAVFADPVRDAVGGGKSWVPSTGKVGGPGATLDIPLAHKDALYVRSNYDTISVSLRRRTPPRRGRHRLRVRHPGSAARPARRDRRRRGRGRGRTALTMAEAVPATLGVPHAERARRALPALGRPGGATGPDAARPAQLRRAPGEPLAAASSPATTGCWPWTPGAAARATGIPSAATSPTPTSPTSRSGSASWA